MYTLLSIHAHAKHTHTHTHTHTYTHTTHIVLITLKPYMTLTVCAYNVLKMPVVGGHDMDPYD